MNAYQILETLREEREKNERERFLRVERLEKRSPEYERLTRERNALLAEAAILSIKGERAKAEDKKKKALELDKRETEILKELGLPKDYLKVHYNCKECEDRGFLSDGRMCRCLKRKIKEAKFLAYDLTENTKDDNFENYDLEVFKDGIYEDSGINPRRLARIHRNLAKEYCKNYNTTQDSLLLFGPPGTGKTFLISCIVNELLKEDTELIYISAPNVIQLIYDDMNERRSSQSSNRKLFKEIDLLIIDDLGTEVNSDFNQSVISEIIDERLLTNKKTIISTNLTPTAMKDRYPARMSSRINGNYQRLAFVGEDLRQK